MYIYFYIWKNSHFFSQKRFLVYIQIKFLCLRCKYSTFVPFSRSICTKINIIFISTWFSTEASFKRLFLQLLLLKNREVFWFKWVFSPSKRVATIERWIFQEVWQMKLQLDNSKLCRIREITLHQSSCRKRLKSEKFQNICYSTDFADHIVSEERFSCFDDVWINLLLLFFVSPALGMYFFEVTNSLSSYPV